MKVLKRYGSVLLILVFLIACSGGMSFAAGESGAADSDALYYVAGDGFSSNNIHIPVNDSNYGSTIRCHFFQENGDYVRVEARLGEVIAETYSSSFKLKATHSVDYELESYGGFFSGSDAYYLVFGQSNYEENNDVEVFRIVKYDKNWKRLGACSVKGANTYIPFDAGGLAMCERDGVLYVHTCHEMYESSDGLHHQANCTFKIQESDMTMLSSNYNVMNLSTGYVSHSFEQKAAADENYFYRADLGDAYPRAVTLSATSHSSAVSRPSRYSSVLEIPGETGENYTGFALGDLGLSDNYAIVTGYGITEDSNARNIFVSATNKDSWETKNTWITDNEVGSNTVIRIPKLVELKNGKFLLMWEETTRTHLMYTTKIAVLGADGSLESDIISMPISLSEAEPIIDDSGYLVWYYTSGSKPMFIRVNPDKLEEAADIANKSNDISLFTVEIMDISDNHYSGDPIEPRIVVSKQDEVLTAGTDYEFTYADNIEPGTGRVIVTGIGNYTGKIERGFTIYKGYSTLEYDIDRSDVELGGTAKIDAFARENAEITFKSADESIATVDADGTVHGIAEGETQIYVSASETEHYSDSSSYLTVTVSRDVHTMEDVSVTYADSTNNKTTVRRKCSVCGHEETVSFTTMDSFYLWFWEKENSAWRYPSEDQTEGGQIRITIDEIEPGDAEDTTIVLESSDPDIMRVEGMSVRFVGTGDVTLKAYAKYRPSVYKLWELSVYHAYDEGTVTKVPTCSEKGQKKYTCSVCGDVYTEELALDPANHTGGTYMKGVKEETCGADGYTGDECCRSCDQIITKGKVIPATGAHTYNAGEITRKPTCRDDGAKTYTCTVCGDTYDEVLPADSSLHQWNDEYTTDDPATCTVDGSESIRCSVCGEAKDTRVIPALGHDWEEEPSVDEEATCTKDGHEAVHCLRCGEVQEGTDVVIPKTGHKFTAWKTTKAATELAAGQRARTCTVCGHVEKQTIAAKKPTLPALTIKTPKAAKKAATIKWTKLSKAKQKKVGYIQVQYSLDKTFKKGVKTVTAKKSAASKKIKKLTSKKTYYVRIRTYKKSGSVVHISKWSKVKSVRAK